MGTYIFSDMKSIPQNMENTCPIVWCWSSLTAWPMRGLREINTLQTVSSINHYVEPVSWLLLTSNGVRLLANKTRDAFTFKHDLVGLEHFLPNMPGRGNALAVCVPCAVLGLANEIIHRFTTNLQGWALECNMWGLLVQTHSILGCSNSSFC